MGFFRCACVDRDSEQIDYGGDLYPVPRRKAKENKIKRESNPTAQGLATSPPENLILKDLIPIQGFKIHVSDNYLLGRELGRGEFGITRLCADKLTKKDFACKTILKSKIKTDIDKEDVRREVMIMSVLPEHPNIVRLHAVYEDSDAVHIVMELCAGGELFDRIVSRGHYSERAAMSILRTIGEVIGICHANGVIHRDLKPENFLFSDGSENAKLKAIDFGLSVFFSPGKRLKDVVGSPFYMAPEVLRRNYGPEVDIWSAGVILYILLCGFPPFWAETDQGIALAILQDSLDFEKHPWPQVSDHAKNLVGQMLERDPKHRLTVQQVLSHPWLQDVRKAPNAPFGDFVRSKLKQFSAMHKFKKKAIRVIAEHFAVEDVKVFRNMFELMDTNGDGKIAFEELKAGLIKAGSLLGETEMKMLMNSADSNGKGFLVYGEFAAVSFHILKMENDNHLRRAFSFFDQNQSGFIEFDELTEALTTGSDSLDKFETAINIMQEVDTDKDGRISYEEFVAMMKSGTDWRKASKQYSRERFRGMSINLEKDGSLKV